MNDDLNELGAAWRAEGISPAEATARAARLVARARVAVAVEWIAGLLVVAFWAIQIARRPVAITWVMGVGSVVFVVVWLGVLHLIIRVPAAGTTARAFLEAAAEQARREARWFAFVRRSVAAFAVFLAPCAAWKFTIDRDFYAAEPWRAVVGFGGVGVLTSLLWVFSGLRRRSALAAAARLEALEREVVGSE